MAPTFSRRRPTAKARVRKYRPGDVTSETCSGSPKPFQQDTIFQSDK
jgi:hypothetical protein